MYTKMTLKSLCVLKKKKIHKGTFLEEVLNLPWFITPWPKCPIDWSKTRWLANLGGPLCMQHQTAKWPRKTHVLFHTCTNQPSYGRHRPEFSISKSISMHKSHILNNPDVRKWDRWLPFQIFPKTSRTDIVLVWDLSEASTKTRFYNKEMHL